MRLGGKESNREFCKGGARVQELQAEGRSKTLMGTGENWERHRCHPAFYDSCKRMTGDMSHVGAIAVGIVYFLAIIDPKITLKDSMARILNGGSRNFQSWGLAGGSGSLEVCFWRWSWAWFFISIMRYLSSVLPPPWCSVSLRTKNCGLKSLNIWAKRNVVHS